MIWIFIYLIKGLLAVWNMNLVYFNVCDVLSRYLKFNSKFPLVMYAYSLVELITNIFLSKKMYSGGGCTNWGEFGKSWKGPDAAEQPHLILLQVKLDYIPNILPQTECPAKLAFRL